MPRVKFPLPLLVLPALALCACNTIENRRSVYHTTKVQGQATRSLEDGSWKHPKTVDEQYQERERQKRQGTYKPGAAPAPSAESSAPVEPAL
jgi:hypothetical protein